MKTFSLTLFLLFSIISSLNAQRFLLQNDYEYSKASQVGKSGCSNKYPGSFHDPRNGGECWSCPRGYKRTLEAVTSSKACAKDLIFGPFSKATYHGSSNCDKGFYDPIRGGTCWTCPSGYERSIHAVTSEKACQKKVNIKINWMSQLLDKKINQISVPGTHDSGADFGCVIPVAHKYALCQDWSIKKQLENGIRFFDIRLHPDGKRFTIHHGICSQLKSFDDVLSDMKNFLRQYPTETIFMHIQQEGGAEPFSDSYKDILIRYYNEDQDIWYNSPLESELSFTPSETTLKDTKGKIVKFNIGDSIVEIQNDYGFSTVEKKWKPVKDHLDAAKSSTGNKVFINFTSCNLTTPDFNRAVNGDLTELQLPTPEMFAIYINPRLRNYLKSNSKGRYGMVLMDFPTKENILYLIKSNF